MVDAQRKHPDTSRVDDVRRVHDDSGRLLGISALAALLLVIWIMSPMIAFVVLIVGAAIFGLVMVLRCYYYKDWPSWR